MATERRTLLGSAVTSAPVRYTGSARTAGVQRSNGLAALGEGISVAASNVGRTVNAERAQAAQVAARTAAERTQTLGRTAQQETQNWISAKRTAVRGSEGWHATGAEARNSRLLEVRKEYDEFVQAQHAKGPDYASALPSDWVESQWLSFASPELDQGQDVDHAVIVAQRAETQQTFSENELGKAGTPDELTSSIGQIIKSYESIPDTAISPREKASQKASLIAKYQYDMTIRSKNGEGLTDGEIDSAVKSGYATKTDAIIWKSNRKVTQEYTQTELTAADRENVSRLGTDGDVGAYLNNPTTSLAYAKLTPEAAAAHDREVFAASIVGGFNKALATQTGTPGGMSYSMVQEMTSRLSTDAGMNDVIESLLDGGVPYGGETLSRPKDDLTREEKASMGASLLKIFNEFQQTVEDGRSNLLFAKSAEMADFEARNSPDSPGYLGLYIANMVDVQRRSGIPEDRLNPLPPQLTVAMNNLRPEDFKKFVEQIVDPVSGVGQYARYLVKGMGKDFRDKNPIMAAGLVTAAQVAVMSKNGNPNVSAALAGMNEFAAAIDWERKGNYAEIVARYPGIESVVPKILSMTSTSTMKQTYKMALAVQKSKVEVDVSDDLNSMTNILSAVDQTYDIQTGGVLRVGLGRLAIFMGLPEGTAQGGQPVVALAEGMSRAYQMMLRTFQVEQINGTQRNSGTASLAITTPHAEGREPWEIPREGAVTEGAKNAGMNNSLTLDALVAYSRPLTMGINSPDTNRARGGRAPDGRASPIEAFLGTRGFNLALTQSGLARNVFGFNFTDSLMPTRSSRAYAKEVMGVFPARFKPNYGTLSVKTSDGKYADIATDPTRYRSIPAEQQRKIDEQLKGFPSASRADREQVIAANSMKLVPSPDGRFYEAYIEPGPISGGMGGTQSGLGPAVPLYHKDPETQQMVPYHIPRRMVEMVSSFQEAYSGSFGAEVANALTNSIGPEFEGTITPWGKYERRVELLKASLEAEAKKY